MKRYKLIIFDFDGTLADSFPWFLKAINVAARKYHFKTLDSAHAESFRHYSHREILKELSISWWKVPLIARFMRKLMKTEIEEISLFPGVSELILEFKKENIKLAIISSNSEENIRLILGSLSSIIDYYACSASLTGKKKKFYKVVKLSGLSSDEVLSVGDEVRDIEAANESKIDAAGVTWGGGSEDILRKNGAKFIFKEISDIKKLVIKGDS